MGQSKKRRENLKRMQSRTWYSSRAMQGYDWARFFVFVGGRGAGKSTDLQRFLAKQWSITKTPFTWLRLSDAEIKKLKADNGADCWEPVVKKQYPFLYNLKVKADNMYADGQLLCNFKALSTFQNDKGTALYNSSNDGWSYLMLDEMNKAVGTRRTGDPVYQFANAVETLLRTKDQKIKIFMIGNLEGLSSMMAGVFNWVPLEGKFGIYKLRSKKAVIHYFDDTEAFKERKKNSTSALIAPSASTFSNVLQYSTKLIDKHARCIKPLYRIKFEDRSYICWKAQGEDRELITLWDGRVTAPVTIPMQRFIDERYDKNLKDNIILRVNNEAYRFRNLITQELFRQSLMCMKT